MGGADAVIRCRSEDIEVGGLHHVDGLVIHVPFEPHGYFHEIEAPRRLAYENATPIDRLLSVLTPMDVAGVVGRVQSAGQAR